MGIVERKTPPFSSHPAWGTIPASDEEWSARQARLTEELASIDAEDDTSDDVYSKSMHNFNAYRS